jgi:hypothetical protein
MIWVQINNDICSRLGNWYARFAGRRAEVVSIEGDAYGLRFGQSEYATLPIEECMEI